MSDIFLKELIPPEEIEARAKALEPLPALPKPTELIPPEEEEARGTLTKELSAILLPYEGMIQGIFKNSKNPMEDYDRLISSAYLSSRVGIPLDQVYQNHDAIALEYWGKIQPAKSNIQAVTDVWKASSLDQKIGMAGFRQMMGDDSPELQKQMDLWEEEKPSPDILMRSWPIEICKSAANMAPYMWENMKYSARIAIPGATIAAALTAAAVAPTAEFSFPAAWVGYFSRFMTLGSHLYTFQEEAGLNYIELIHNGTPKNIAKWSSLPVGLVNMAWENFEIANIPGWANIKGKLLEKLTGETVKNTIYNGAINRITQTILGGEVKVARTFAEKAAGGLGRFLNVAAKEYLFKGQLIEPATEVFQEISNVVSGALASSWSKMAKDPDIIKIVQDAWPKIFTPENRDRLLQTYFETAKSMLLMGAGGLVSGGRVAVREAIAQKVETGEVPSGAEAAAPVVVGEAPPGPPGVRVPTAPTAEAPYRTAEGRVFTAQYPITHTREGTIEQLRAGDLTTGKRYGYISYETVDNRIYVQDVVNDTATDLRRELMLDLAARYPGQEIEWNPINDADIALKEELIASNPLGPEKGLQWFPAPTATMPTAQETLSRTFFVEQLGKLFNAETPAQAELYGKLADTFAQVAGETTQDWLNRYIAPKVGLELTPERQAFLVAHKAIAATEFRVGEKIVEPLAVGEEQFKGTVKAVFVALKGADFHHGISEFFHAVERLALSKDQIKKFETALGKLREAWTVEDVEKLADYFEDYLATGKAPTPELQSVFQQIAAALVKLISFIKERLSGQPGLLSSEFLAAYDSMFKRPESGLATAPVAAPVAPIVEPTMVRAEARTMAWSEYAAFLPYSTPVEYILSVKNALAQGIAIPNTVIDSYHELKSQIPERTAVEASAIVVPQAAEKAITVIDLSAVPAVEIELSRITLCDEVPNMKEDANAEGIVPGEELQGDEYVKVGIPPITLWERLDGRLQVISGRHRWRLALRLGLKTIFSQIVREVDGFTAAKAMRFDAESNIRDGQGTVRDYANYFRNTTVTDKEASSRGLLDRNKGRTGFAIGHYASDGLYSLFRSNQIGETKAAAITAVALHDEQLQELGITKAKSMSAEELTNFLALAKQYTAREYGGQIDMFGKNDALVRESEKMTKAATSKQSELNQEKSALRSALKLSKGEQAKIVSKYGFKSGDIVAIMDRVDVLSEDIELWKTWYQNPVLMQETRMRAGLPAIIAALMHFEPPEPTEKPFELVAYEDELIRPKPKVSVQQQFSFAKKTAIELKDEADNYVLFHRDPDLEARFNKLAVSVFGTTDNPRLCGWILSNGKMLDFDWYKHMDSPRYFSRIGHIEIRAVTDQIFPKKMHAYSGAWKAGALRIDPGIGICTIQSTMIPTFAQLKTIDIATQGLKAVGLEIMNEDGVTEIGWEQIEDPSMEDIRRFYTKQNAYLNRPTALYHLDPADQERLNKKMIEFFGLTDNLMEAGYILSDGQMLDFSGRHEAMGYEKGKPLLGQPDYLARGRVIDHRALPEGLFKADTDVGQMLEFMSRSGAVRLDANVPFIDSIGIPTEAQLFVIRDVITIARDENYDLAVDVSKVDGSPIAGILISNPSLAKLRAFYREVQKSEPNPGDLNALFHAEDVKETEPWLSKSLLVVNEKMRGPMPAANLKSMLLASGVKVDEMRWTGLDDFLEESRKITPDEIREFIDAHAVRLKEVRYGLQTISPEDAARIDDAKFKAQDTSEKLRKLKVEALTRLSRVGIGQADRINMVDHMTLWMAPQGWDQLKEEVRIANQADPGFDWVSLNRAYRSQVKAYKAWDELKDITKQNLAQYSNPDYRLIDGTNYREILLTLPHKPIGVDIKLGEPSKPLPLRWEQFKVEGCIIYPVMVNGEDVGYVTYFPKTFESFKGNIREGPSSYVVYTSVLQNAHFSSLDECNESLLRVYGEKANRGLEFVSGHFKGLPNILAWLRIQDTTDLEGKKILMVEEIQSDWHQKGREKGYGEEGVPVAPFAKTWHELAFRRAVREAVAGDYQGVTWTTGEQQNDRWNLAKLVDAIRWVRRQDGTYWLEITKDGNDMGRAIGLPEILKEDELGNYIGKDLAAKIVSTPDGQFEMYKSEVERANGLLSGPDLKVGGRGMRVFYDTMLVDYANKLGKKWGAKVQDMMIKAEKGGVATSYIEFSDWMMLNGHSMDETSDEWRTEGKLLNQFMEEIRGKQQVAVHGLPINQAMRAGVEKGEVSQLFHLDEWQGDLLYGTPIDEEIYQTYVEEASGYASPEAFRADMEKKYGEPQEGDIAGEEATRFYREVWEEANKPEPIAPEPTRLPIEAPIIPSQVTYDYQEKVEAARNISDAQLAARVEAGEATAEDMIKLETESQTSLEKLREQTDEAEEAADTALADLTPEEQVALRAGDELEDAMVKREQEPDEAKREVLERRIKSLRIRLRNALVGNIHVAAIMDEQGAWKRILAREAPVEEAQAYAEGITFGREIQKLIDTEKAKGKLKETKVRMWAEKREALRVLRESIRNAKAERRAAKRLKDARRKLIADIVRPPGRGIQFKGYAEQIRIIQEGLDPTTREYRIKAGVPVMEKTMRGYAREQSRKFFAEHPEAAAAMSKETLEKIYSIPLQDMTLAQLEEIGEKLDQLRKLGTLYQSIEMEQKARRRMKTENSMVGTVLRGKPLEKPIGGVKATAKWFSAWLATLKPARVFALLDGVFEGGEPGVFSKLGQKQVNEDWSAYKKGIRERTSIVLGKMEDLKFTLDPLDPRRLKGFEWVGRTFDIEGFQRSNGKPTTLQNVMFWYLGMQNEKTAKALLKGNNLPMSAISKAISMLTENERALADAIAEDFETNFPRLRDAFIDAFNVDLPGENHYVPMRRMEISYENRMDEVAAELVGRAGVRKQFIARNPTYERLDIDESHQKPIREDLVNLWIEGVKVQEGFIHQDATIKEMHAILESDKVRAAILQKYGPAMNKWISKYINDLAQAEAYTSMMGLERLSRMGRAHATAAWLGFNLLSVAKQSMGMLTYLADLGPLAPVYLISSCAQFAAGTVKSTLGGEGIFRNTLVDFVKERSELIRNRQISEEFENLKRLNPGAYNNIVKKIGRLGLVGLELVDTVTVVTGWKAVYDKVMAETNGDEVKAIEAAEAATIRTQPSARVQDMAEIYRSGEIAKWFTMFTSELSAIWNRLTFDVPLAFRRKAYLYAITDLTSIALSGMGIALAMGALHGNDEEKKRKKMLMGLASQFIESWPIIGNDAFAIISGKQFQSGGVKILPAVTSLMMTAKQVTEADWDDALKNALETLALASGLPYAGPRRALKWIRTGDIEQLLGWPVEKK